MTSATSPAPDTTGPVESARVPSLKECAVVVLFIVAVYFPSLLNNYIWDDDFHVTRNPALDSLGGLWRIWTERGATPQYYPFVHTSFWIERRLWGLAPDGYHFVNILLHALNAVVAWRLLSRLRIPGALLACMIFALNPVHVESVTWISERKNVLSGLFYLLALSSILERWEGGRARKLVAALTFFLLALLSKSVTATLPVAALVIQWMRAGRLSRRNLLDCVPFLLLGLALGLNTVHMEKSIVGASGRHWDFSLLDRAALCSRILWFYPAKFAWPSGLAFIYERWTVPLPPIQAIFFASASVVLVCLLVRAASLRSRAPLAAALFFAVTIAPASGFFDVYPFLFSFVADHFQYLASLGTSVFLGALAARIAERAGAPAPRLFAALLLFSGFAAVSVSVSQQFEYRDERTLWTATARINPNSTMVWNNLAAFELNHGGDLASAERATLRVLEIEPSDYTAIFNLADLAMKRGDAAEAVRHYSRLATAKDPDARGLLMVSTIFSSKGRDGEALPFLERAVEVAPDWGAAHLMLAQALARLGRAADAGSHFQRAAELGFDEAGLNEALQNPARHP